jgi:hypothetical protein
MVYQVWCTKAFGLTNLNRDIRVQVCLDSNQILCDLSVMSLLFCRCDLPVGFCVCACCGTNIGDLANNGQDG